MLQVNPPNPFFSEKYHIDEYSETSSEPESGPTLYHHIVQRIKLKRKTLRGPTPAPMKCPECSRKYSYEWDQLSARWNVNGFDGRAGKCKRCVRIAKIRSDPEKVLRSARVPPKYLSCTFDSLIVTNGIRNALDFCRKYTLKDKQTTGLFLFGPCGTGKTHLAVAITRGLLLKGHQVIFTTVQELLMEIRRAFGSDASSVETEEYYLNKYVSFPFLVLDDLGVEKTTEWNRQVLDYLINERDVRMKPLIVTSNLNVADIANKIDQRVASRLAGMCSLVELKGPDFRRR